MQAFFPSKFPRHLPDVLNLARVVLAAVFALSVLAHTAVSIQLGLLLAAAVTDLCDGPIARRMGVADRFGAFLDVLADKISMICIFIALAAAGAVPAALTGAVIVRELLVLAARVVAHRNGLVVRHTGGLLNAWIMLAYSVRAVVQPDPAMDWAGQILLVSSILTGAWTLWVIWAAKAKGE